MSRQNDEAAALVRAYFGACVDCYGHDPRGVDWQSAAAQRARFAGVLAVGDLDGATLLDAGCGLGDFYGYLRERGIAARYTGCDLSTPHVEAACKAYPDARFVAADVQTVLAGERFDYVIGCGLLHLRVPRWNRWAWSIVRAMYDGCLRGIAFTLPRRGAGHPPVLAAVDPADWLARLRTLSPTVEAHPLDPWGDTMFMLRKQTTSDGGPDPG
jgi:SAM-dependent methyltransferase